MELKKISDRIYCLPFEEATDRPVLGYIKGDKYCLAIDAGNSEKHVEKFYKELADAGLKLPDFIVVTHWHWDHTFGMHAVSGKTISGRNTNDKLKEVTAWEWSDTAMKERLENGQDIEFCDTCIKLEYEDRSKIKVVTADMVFSGHMSIDLGGITCELMEIDSPHSRDAVLVFIPEERVLFVGDADCSDHYDNGGKYDKERLKDYIELIDSMDFDNCVLGHSDAEGKAATIEYLKGELKNLE